jgi:hypothetical protein
MRRRCNEKHGQRKDKEIVLKNSRLAIILMLGMILAPLAARTSVAQLAAGSTAAVATVPVDQQPTKEQLTKLFEVMRLRQQMDAFLKRVPAMVQQQMKAQTKQMVGSLPNGSALTAEQQAAVDKITTKYMQRALSVITIDEMVDDLIPIYQRHLSSSDVNAYIAFYESAAGQHMLDQQPAIMEEYMPIAVKNAQEHSKQLTEDLVKELTAAVKQPTPAQDTPEPK